MFEMAFWEAQQTCLVPKLSSKQELFNLDSMRKGYSRLENTPWTVYFTDIELVLRHYMDTGDTNKTLVIAISLRFHHPTLTIAQWHMNSSSSAMIFHHSIKN